MSTLEIILLGVISVLILVLVYEAVQYKKFILAQRALMSMGASMQTGFEQVIGHLNILSQDTMQLKQDTALTDQELVVIRTILDLHGEKLDMQQLKKMFTIVDNLKEKEDG